MGLTRRGVVGALAALPLVAPMRAATAGPVVQAFDPAFAEVVAPDARVRTVFAGGMWCEGPCWAPDLGGLVFSDTRAGVIRVLAPDGTVSPLRDPSNNANGNILDAKGRLVTCEHRGRRVVRRGADGGLTVIADSFDGKRLNSPNDLALAPDGGLWFTDPVFGIVHPEEGLTAALEQAERRVYRIDPDTLEIEAMIDGLDQPNGVVFSPNGATLYVSDTGVLRHAGGAHGVVAYEMRPDGGPGGGRVFMRAPHGVPDGIAVDAAGRLYAACGDGVRVYAPDGKLLGRIATATKASNMAFGGGDLRRLFITSGPHIFAVDTRAEGFRHAG